MRGMIAFCGLDCEKCEARIATINDDNNLRKKVADKWSKLNNIEILPEHINCLGCRGEGPKTYYCSDLCEIRKCVMGKKLESCGKCTEMNSCKIIGAVLENSDEARQNLKNQ